MFRIKTYLILISLFILHNVFGTAVVSAVGSDVQFEAEIIAVIKQEERVSLETKHMYQELELLGISGKYNGKKIRVESGTLPVAGVPLYQRGQKVVVNESIYPDGTKNLIIVDFVRRDALYTLFLAFIIVSLLVARRRAIGSLLGLGISFFVIFSFVLPRILAGDNPVLIAVLAGCIVVPLTYYISHGWSNKTHIAVLGTLIALLITGLISYWAIESAQLTGYSSEEVSFLQGVIKSPVNMKALILAGIIIGLFGILDDVTISQASIVEKLHEVSPGLSPHTLYIKAMDVGKDHIASVINTLILVYTGAALPFLLLFVSSSTGFHTALNFEIIAEEIIKMLTSSIGLILAVPITTFLAVLLKSRLVQRSNKSTGRLFSH
ncbi:MAG: YibE/F-like protein [Microgenomates bacterium OLB22]|nr:MAG: YibE/F-like protein [Microgenomates bacterium OLB22]